MSDLEKQYALWLEYVNKKKIADRQIPSDYNSRSF